MLVRHTAFENTPYETTLKTALAGGSPLDIAEMDSGANAFVYARAGLLADVSDTIAPLRKHISPGMELIFEYQGKAYGIPWQLVIGNLLWYNPKMFADAGIDPAMLDTWDGAMAVAEAFKAKALPPSPLATANAGRAIICSRICHGGF